MRKCSNARPPLVLRGVIAGLVLIGLISGCAMGLYRENADREHASQRLSRSSPLLWSGQDEPGGAGINADAFNGRTHFIGKTRVDYIGSLNPDSSYAGSPAQTAERRLIGRAGGKSNGPDGRLTVDFEDDSLDYFVQQMLGGFLGVNYLVADDLAGSVTFRTEVPIAKSQALPVVRSILARHGYVLKLIGGVLYVARPETVEQAEENIRAGRAGERTTRVIALPVKADESLAESLGALVPAGISILLSPDRRSLVVQANIDEIDDAERLVGTFVQGEAARSLFAVIYLHNSPPENVAAKLLAFFASHNGDSALAPLSVIPLEERQALLVAARTESAIENVRRIASQLDFGLQDEVTLRIIPLRHLAAADIAARMSSVFGDESGVPTVSAVATGESAPDMADSVAEVESAPGTEGKHSASAVRQTSAGNRIEQAFEERPEGRIAVDSSDTISIVADERNNVLLVRSSYRNFKRIREAVRTLDVPLSQVVIEATIIEVKITEELKYGVQWFLSGTGFTVRSSQSASTADPGLAGFAATVQQLYSGISVNAVIEALDDVTDVSVISSPYLTVLNQKTARLVVGDQIPFATRSQSSNNNGNVTVTQDVEIKDTGVILEVKPVIRANNAVELRVAQELSSAEQQAGGSNLTPTITTRQITSDIVVQSGRTVLLGGLIQERTVQQKSGVPLLRKAPLIGRLFEQTANTDLRTEVVVMITPRVARTTSQIERITDQLRHHLNLPLPVSDSR